MATLKRGTDRRIQRTQQALRQAFLEVVVEKGFIATSIQDITERANVNRGTFYIHFADKFELLDRVMREQFHQQMASNLPSDPQWNKQHLYLLVRAVLDNFEGKYRHQPRPSPLLAEVAPMLERAVQEELADILLAWLKGDANVAALAVVQPETVARVVSWAIFGSALQWSQEPTTILADQMAREILVVIVEGLANLIPGKLPE